MNNTVSPTKCLRYLLQADAIVLVKNKRAVIISMLLPLAYLFIFHSEKAQSRFGGPGFIVAFSITVGLFSAAILGYTLTVARDREKGIFQRLRTTPAPTWTIMVSRLLVQAVANLIITIVVLVVASILYDFSLGISEYALILLLATVGGAVFLSIGQAIVGLLKSADTVNASGRIVFIILLLLGLLGPSGVLGSAIQTISNWTPIGTVIAVLESGLHQTAWSGTTSLYLLTCFGYIVAFCFIGIKWFKWDAR